MSDKPTYEDLLKRVQELQQAETNCKKAEAELREREESYRLLVENSNDLIWTFDLSSMTYTYCSKSVERVLGYLQDEVVGTTLDDIFSPEMKEKVTNAFAGVLSDETHSNQILVQAEHRHKNGGSVWMEINALLNRDRDCQPISFTGVSRDITARKKAEQALKENEERYKKAQLMGHVGNWEYNLKTEKFWGSDEARRIYGFNPESLDFTTEEVENCVTERERVHQALIDLIEKNKPYNLEFEIQPVDGSDRKFIKSIAEIVKDESGEPLKVAGVIHDITQQKEAEKARIILERRLKQSQKMESIGNLAGGIAHDFNNILSSIIGFTELAFDEIEKNTEIEDYLQEIFRAGNRARDLVRQILVFARQSEEEIKPILIVPIAKEVIKFIRSSIPATIEIRQEIRSNSLIMGNATQVHQLLMNLCTNAAHSMENDGGTLEVSLKDVKIDDDFQKKGIDLTSGNYLEIKVSDTGTGIGPDTIDSIFEPYFTTKAPGEGTGMGLAMVHGIVESYGGGITVDSEPGKGSAFTIYLPTTKISEQHRPYEQEMLPFGSERILFVDDEAPIVRMGSQILERLGYSVITRTSSVEALELFRARPNDFDLVITDMTMPNMTGDRLAIALIEIRQDIPVIMCTGYSRKISDERAAEIGIKGFAYKPVAKADLAKTVRSVLDEMKAGG